MTPDSDCDALFIGIDLGTSGCRAVAIDSKRDIVAEFSTILPPPLRDGAAVEQDPIVWWDATKHTLSTLLASIPKEHVRSIAIDGTSGTVLLVDKDGQPLGNALMYNDSRATKEAEQIAHIAPSDCAAHGSTSGLAKFLWLQKQDYAAQACWVLNQADWIAGKLTHCFGISDQNNCLKLGYDAIEQCWPDWLTKLDINLSCLPGVYTPGAPVATLSADVARAFGLSEKVKLMAGTTDSTAAFIATGAHKPGEAVTSLGSTLVLKVISDKPVFSPEYGIYSQPLNDYWLVGGGSNSGGAVLLHYFSHEQLQTMTAQLQPATPTGLDYYPLVSMGERFPVNDAKLAAKLTPRPDNDVEFFQAMLEGIAKIELSGYQRLASLGVPFPDSIRSVGGGAKNRPWQQIRQRLLNVEFIDPPYSEAAYGAALLASGLR